MIRQPITIHLANDDPAILQMQQEHARNDLKTRFLEVLYRYVIENRDPSKEAQDELLQSTLPGHTDQTFQPVRKALLHEALEQVAHKGLYRGLFDGSEEGVGCAARFTCAAASLGYSKTIGQIRAERKVTLQKRTSLWALAMAMTRKPPLPVRHLQFNGA